MAIQVRSLPLVAAAVCGVIASAAPAQIAAADPGARTPEAVTGARYHTGPHDSLGLPPPAAPRPDFSRSVLLHPPQTPPGGFLSASPSVGAPGLVPADQGGGSRFVDQSINCAGDAWFSNGNSNVNPFIVVDDFVADDRPLVTVQFYGGVWGGSLSAVNNIQVEIWTTASGGECGWTYATPIYIENFPMAELHPQYECVIAGGLVEAYEFTANMEAPLSLVPGQTYMITIYAWLANPDGQQIFALADTAAPTGNPAGSLHRSTHDYVRCSPDMAFRTLPAGSCQENDCQTTCYYSNYFSNVSPYLSFDDFTAASTGDLLRLEVTGGMYDEGAGVGADFDNLAGLVVEIYDAQVDLNSPCGNWLSGFVGDFGVTLEHATPRYDCTDTFGISHYTFTIEAPPGISLVAGQRYLMGVYGVPVDPDSPELFCWGGTDALYGFTSSSYNLDTHTQESCHEVDMAFCIDPERPCIGDFNEDWVVDTRDVIAFLNAWTDGDLAADMDYNLLIDSRDVLAFLNYWNTDCLR